MKVDKRRGSQGKDERRIITGMVVDTIVLSRISAIWEREQGLFKSTWANIVAGWCIRYFKKYGEAPARNIEGIFERWSKRQNDKNQIETVERFLSSLSDEYEGSDLNVGFLTDVAGDYFNQVKLTRLADELQEELDGDCNIAKALEMVGQFETAEVGEGVSIDLMQDKDALSEAFTVDSNPLVVFPGALGRFINQSLNRGAFIAFMGPEKRGKSFWLLETAWRSLSQRKRVAYFECGDMGKWAAIRRFASRAARHPLYVRRSKPKLVRLPTLIHRSKDGEYSCRYKNLRFTKSLNVRRARLAFLDAMKYKIRSEESYIKLCSYATGELSVDMIKSKLQLWYREGGWTADVVVIDYADILAPPVGIRDPIEQIDRTWQALRGIALSFHCMVVTATQSNTESYTADTLHMKHFSGNKRKLAHTSGVLGLNQTKDEKAAQLLRINWVVRRDFEHDERRCVRVAECRGLANVVICSRF